MQIDGFVYQFLDSRGGTIFVVADNRTLANEKLLVEMNGPRPTKAGRDQEFWDGQRWMADENFVYRVTLHVPDSFALPQGKYESVDLQQSGRVIAAGNRTEMTANGEEDDFLCRANALIMLQLEWVPEGQKPTHFQSWSEPRWNDDAYGFVLVP